MADDDIYQEFIEKLKKDKTEQEAAKFVAGLLQIGSIELYTTMVYFLQDEDVKAINDEPDDEKAKVLIREKFKLRTGMTPEEFMTGLRDSFAKGYLFPDLYKKTQ